MPELTNAEIETGIGDGSVYALAIDTSVFDRFGCDLRHPKLRLLHQFSDSETELLLPEVVAREVLGHIAKKAADTQATARKAIAEYRRRWQREADEAPKFDEDCLAEAARQLKQFVTLTGAKEIPLFGSGDLAAKAVDLYFATEPPFEKHEQKKHEFPDALALLSLESLAGRRGGMILCVSADKGWQAFCARSDDLLWVEDLDTALSFFHRSGRTRAEEVWRSLRERGRNSLFYAAVHNAFRTRLRALDFIPDVRSSFDSITTPVFEDLEKIDLSTATAPLVIEADDETVTFSFKVKANVIFTAEFDFYASHPLGEETIDIATVQREVEKTFAYEVLLTVTRDGSALQAIRSAFVDRPRARVDFGTIDPFDR